MGNNDQYYLKVYTDKSELVGTSGSEVFIEGDMTDEAKGIYREIQDQLENGYLRELFGKQL